MTVQKELDFTQLPFVALCQWLSVALSHAAIHKHSPYIERTLLNSDVLLHDLNTITVEFPNNLMVEVSIRVIDQIPEGGIQLPVFA